MTTKNEVFITGARLDTDEWIDYPTQVTSLAILQAETGKLVSRGADEIIIFTVYKVLTLKEKAA